ncbi:MAG: hypothetical protein AB9M53_02520 [Leptothrix sp. (in: b-proteobacteria)]
MSPRHTSPFRPFRSVTLSLLGAALMLAHAPLALAQQDKNAERNLRRMQLQLQQAQQQLQEAQSAKTKAETERAALEKQLSGQARELPRVQGVLRKAGDELKAAEAARAELVAQLAARDQRVGALESQLQALDATLAGQRRSSDEAQLRQERALAQAGATLHARDAALAQGKRRFDEQLKQTAECSDRNARLGRLNAALLSRYRDKGVVDALRQQEPVFGLGEVQLFNLLQDERDKAEAERFVPAPEPSGDATASPAN